MSKQGILISVAGDQEGATPKIVTKSDPLPIALFDIHHQIVNRLVHFHSAVATTVSTASAANDYILAVADTTGFAVNDYIHINTTTLENTHPKITAITPGTPGTFTLDRRLDGAHGIGDEVTKAIIDMSTTAGTLADPIEYSAWPAPGEIFHITRVIFSMFHGTAGDFGLFGNLAQLTNGVLIRVRQNGVYRTFTNWKNNADIKTDMYDVQFDSRSGGQGDYGTSGRLSFFKAGATIELNGNTDDRFEVYIQDDITGLGFFGMKIQGHEVIT